MNTRLITLIVGAALTFAAAASPAAAQAPSTPAPQAPAVTCVSTSAERVVCPANTSSGVALQQSTGAGACLLGKTWGYDDKSVWVSDRCGGVFTLGQTTAAVVAPPPTGAQTGAATGAETPQVEYWGEFNPGKGFLVGKSNLGQLSISGYALLRYMNQTPASQTYTDHLGNERTTDGRHDISAHRIMVFFTGWLGSPKLIYAVTFWTVNATDQRAIFANVGYQFSRKFGLWAGLNGNPGTRSLQGSHPYWLAPDRVMADEFFRPFFGSGIWAQGELVPGFWYNAVLTNNNSALGVRTSQLDRSFTTGGSVWWMPTTKEFGPRGGYGDWEWHEQVATRFGVSTTRSPEERFTNSASGGSDNTTIRLADSVNVFDTGALASGVTVDRVDYRILSFDAGLKYKGVFVQTEIYNRWLDNFKADGVLPVGQIHDTGFYVQAAFYPVKKKLEVYGATSQVFGDKDAGFANSSEYLAGMNFYPFNTRNHRLNMQVIDINRSPVSSAFGYYTGGQKGTTFSAAFSVFF